ncbi:hypothetical protein [Aquimarina macrocephali]|uniref:hypothetical protein n=1 Tax=Aquimarina macrocephali TaxID=666563 RepID=UPI000465FDC4|nr:hypothetical protein [Aquimarina macrocephali]
MNENIELNKRKSQFLFEIIQYVQVEKDEFLQRVANQECYETIIYNWAIRLFEKGTSLDDAITIIHRARRFILMYSTRHTFDYHMDMTIENIHSMLSEYPEYNALPSDKKQIVQQNIVEKFDQKARLEAIEQVLKKMHLEGRLEPDDNEKSTFKAVLLRIITSIRKWKRIGYWQHKKKNRPK